MLKLPGGSTNELNEMGQVFYDCLSVKELNLEGLDVSGVTNMNRLFWNCPSLTTVFVNENWNVDHIRAGIAEGKYNDHGQMFSGCTNLVGGNGTKCVNRLGQECEEASIKYANIDQWDVAGYLTCFNADTGKVLIKGDPSPGSILTATTQSIPSGKTLDYQWLRDGSPIPGATDYQYTASDDDVEHKISCQAVVDGRYTLVSNTVSVGLPAFAVYSADDNSLNFYKRSGVPSAGEAFEGKTASKVYTNFENETTRSWGEVAKDVTDIAFIDEGIHPISTESWFNSFTSLQRIEGLNKLDTSNVTSMSFMFYNCSSLTSVDVSRFSTSNVTNMDQMFFNCRSVTALDVSAWNTSNVTNMHNMFFNCYFLTSLDVSSWNTTKVTALSGMFLNCSSLTSLDVSSWITSQVSSMSSVFNNCSSLTSLDVSAWDTSNVTSMFCMFSDCSSLTALDISGWNTSKVKNMQEMFFDCTSLVSVYAGDGWSTEATTASIGMFSNCLMLVGSKGTVYDDSHTDAAYAHIDGGETNPGYFTEKSDPVLEGTMTISGEALVGFTLIASATSASEGAELSCQWLRDGSPIDGATGSTYTLAEADIDHTITCIVTASGFSGSLTSNEIGPIAKPEPKAFAVYSEDDNSLNFYKRLIVPTAGEQFEGKTATEVYTDFEEQAARPWSGQAANVTSVTFVDEGITPVSTTSWFSAFTKLLDINGLSKLDTSKVTSMQNMFNNCRSLTSFDISSFDTSQVTDMRSMFNGCYKLTSLDLSNFDTSNVTNMKMMFTNCSALTSLDLSSFDTSGASDISFMFSNCKTLETIFVAPGVDWSSVQTSTNMFINCSKLTGGNGTKYDQTKIDAAYARIDGLNGQPGYFTDKNAPEKTEVEKQLESMTLHEKVCQMFTVYPEDLGGSGALTVAGSTQQKTLQNYPYGGVCYFLQNIKNETQAKTLVSTLESYSEVPLFHAVDEEGGRVQRIGGTTYSGAVRGAGIGNQLNAMYTYKDQGTDTAYNNAQLLAANLNRLGMNWDFAPCADVNSNPSNPVIGDRAYGDDFDATGELVASAVRGFNDAGVATALKHFPGHGDTATDSHTGAAAVSKTLDQLRTEEFKSFKAGIAAGADSVMMGHLMIEGAKESVPTSCSYEFVTEVLRNELGFDGVITTDGMGMGALTKVFGTTKQGHIDAVMACLKAGIDVFLLPGDPAACVDAIEAAVASGEISEDRIDASVKRILTLKEKIAANKSKRNAATLQAMHAAAVADEELTAAATQSSAVETKVAIEVDTQSAAVGDTLSLRVTTEGVDETDHVTYRWYISSKADMTDKTLVENATQGQIEYLLKDPGTWYFQCEVVHGEHSFLSKPVAIEATTPEGRQ